MFIFNYFLIILHCLDYYLFQPWQQVTLIMDHHIFYNSSARQTYYFSLTGVSFQLHMSQYHTTNVPISSAKAQATVIPVVLFMPNHHITTMLDYIYNRLSPNVYIKCI